MRTFALLLVAALALAGCAKESAPAPTPETSPSPTPTPPATPTPTPAATPPLPAARTWFNLTGTDASVWIDEKGATNPSLSAPPSSTVRFTYRALGEVPHDLKVGDVEGDIVSSDDAPGELMVTTPVAGSLEYVCTLHPTTMKGTLVINTAAPGGQAAPTPSSPTPSPAPSPSPEVPSPEPTPSPSPVPSPEPAPTATVDIRSFRFSPGELAVATGTVVTWTNADSTPHTATSTSGPAQFDSGRLDQGESFTFTFSTPGSYAYRCSLHSFMTGTVTVG